MQLNLFVKFDDRRLSFPELGHITYQRRANLAKSPVEWLPVLLPIALEPHQLKMNIFRGEANKVLFQVRISCDEQVHPTHFT